MDRSGDRVLFITSGNIGDAVLTTGLLRHFVESEPQARFTIAAGPRALPLFADTPRLERLIEVHKGRRAQHWLELWRQVAGRRWSAIIDMRGSALAFLLWAQRRNVYRSIRLAPGEAPPHKVLEAARTIGRLEQPPSPMLYISATRQSHADALIGPGGPVLALAPAATWPPKTWAGERFAETALALLGPSGPLADGRALLIGGRDDGRFLEPLRAALPPSRVIDIAGLDLLTAYACLRRVRLFIGNDSGPMHLAAAAGAPTLGLFGPSDDRMYRPWGPQAAFIRAARTGGSPSDAGSMDALSVAEVVRAATELLERTQAKDAAIAAV